jgi:hypothetical protein
MRHLMNVEYYRGLLLEMDRPDRADKAATTVAMASASTSAGSQVSPISALKYE